jgi:hypothetical protein
MFTAKRVVTSTLARLSTKLTVPLLPINPVFTFVFTGDYFCDNVIRIKKCVMCHFYAQDTLPVPAVMVVVLNPPAGDPVVPVSPPPIVMV